MEEYRHQLEGFLESMGAFDYEHASAQDLDQLKDSLKANLPLSQVLDRDLTRDAKELKSEGKDIDRFIHALKHNDFFKTTLHQHISEVHVVLRKITPELEELTKGNLIRVKELASLRKELRGHLYAIELALEHALDLFSRINERMGVYMGDDIRFQKLVQKLHTNNPELHMNTYLTDLLSPFHGAIVNLHKLIDFVRETKRNVAGHRVVIDNAIDEVKKDLNPDHIRELESAVDKLTYYVVNFEQRLYHDHLPMLYTFERTVKGVKTVFFLEDDVAKALSAVYEHIRKEVR